MMRAVKSERTDGQADLKERTIRDLISGEFIEVVSPGSFELDTILLDSAYYKYRGSEYRFLLCKARQLGLKIA